MTDLKPMTVIDDAAVARAEDVLIAEGIRVDAKIVRKVLVAAVDATPEPAIPVSDGMFRVGLKVWLENPTASPHVRLPALYRAMEQQRRDEATAQAAPEAPADEQQG